MADEFSKFFKKLMEFECYASKISRPSAIFLAAHEVFSEILDADRMIENDSNAGLSGGGRPAERPESSEPSGSSTP